MTLQTRQIFSALKSHNYQFSQLPNHINIESHNPNRVVSDLPQLPISQIAKLFDIQATALFFFRQAANIKFLNQVNFDISHRKHPHQTHQTKTSFHNRVHLKITPNLKSHYFSNSLSTQTSHTPRNNPTHAPTAIHT